MRVIRGSDAQATVEQMIEADRPFDEIEDFINEQPLADDVKSALWLLAWLRLESGTQIALLAEIVTAS